MSRAHMTYKQVVEELVNSGVNAKEGAYFEYEFSPIADIFENFWNAGQYFLESDDLKEFFDYPRLYYCSNTSFNAGAYSEGKYSLVEIFAGAIVHLHQLYYGIKDAFKNEAIEDYNNVSSPFLITPHQYLFQIATSFLLYHEAGHLIQQNNVSRAFFEFQEDKCIGRIEERHVKEFDADWFASNRLVMQILALAEDVNGKPDTETKIEFLHKMAELALAAIYISFVDLAEGQPDIYYAKYCHPHPAVRLTYLVLHFVDTVHSFTKITIDRGRIIRNTVVISTELTQATRPHLIEYWSKSIFQESKRIDIYIKKLILDCDKYPECCRNKLPTNKSKASRDLSILWRLFLKFPTINHLKEKLLKILKNHGN